MEARYCKHCGAKLKPFNTDRCMKCFIEQTGGIIHATGYWRR